MLKDLYIKISKFSSYVLRHHPEKYGLTLDEKGYANLKRILNILDNRFQSEKITLDTLKNMIKESDKKRFEITNDKIRAYYGHSIDKKIKVNELNEYPEKLYHGTTQNAYNKIKKKGVKKQARQYVHLSRDIETAKNVGKRRTKNPIILQIDVIRAKNKGIKFYKSGDIFLADNIPASFIKKLRNGEITQ
ncbi:MAG: RNA 2'-phosphotransferase [Candidatus Lokiarchaeota archaeon]|nr:RNA 2'-phosphotransferase [Candidatus Lokiarchaeota archaeon]